ncbi:MAG TPA: hypothetical protein VKB08_11985, partial [Bradyrhizobium sp.]|nr:hypothetical protein [Bradyrhizobium sp.]
PGRATSPSCSERDGPKRMSSASMIAGMRITDLAMAVMPWLLTMLVFLVIVTYWPGLTLWLPRVLGLH